MFNQDNNKPKAVWHLEHTEGDNKLYVSEGGAIKITTINQDGDEVQVYMGPVKQFDKILGMLAFIESCKPKVQAALSAHSSRKDREYIQKKAAVQASKALESLKALGLTPEQVAQLLTQKAG